jgi:hypothetical protein
MARSARARRLTQREQLVRRQRAQHQRAAENTWCDGSSPAPSHAHSTPKSTSSSASSAASGALNERATTITSVQGIANCATPSNASHQRSPFVAPKGIDQGKVTSAETTAPRNTAGSRSRRVERWLCWISVQFTAPAIGTASAMSMPCTLRASLAPSSRAYIHAMPAPAARIATNVRGARRWPSARRAASAVNIGPVASVTSTFATVVIVIAIMNAVYMTAQQRLARASGAPPARRLAKKCRGPRSQGRVTESASAVKALRQNVTSMLAADSS